MGTGAAALFSVLQCVCLIYFKLLGTIRSLAPPEDLPDVHVDTHCTRRYPPSFSFSLSHSWSLAAVFDLTLHVTADEDSSRYVQALRNRMQATEQLVAAFVKVGGEARQQLLHDEEQRKCLRSQSEVGNYRLRCL